MSMASVLLSSGKGLCENAPDKNMSACLGGILTDVVTRFVSVDEAEGKGMSGLIFTSGTFLILYNNSVLTKEYNRGTILHVILSRLLGPTYLDNAFVRNS
jgi:hypothetical protein